MKFFENFFKSRSPIGLYILLIYQISRKIEKSKNKSRDVDE